MLKLYDYYRSSASFRVRIALNIKNLNYDKIPIHLLNNGGEQFSPEYQKINPQSLVPTLLDDDKIITQSLAIIEYLNEKYPDPPLFPNDMTLKAHIRSFAFAIAADIHPLNNRRILNYLTDNLKLSEEQKNKWYQHWIQLGLSALEKILQKNNSHSHYCFGESPTLADICLIPQIYNAHRFNCDVSDFPTLMRIYDHCQQQSVFIDAWPREEVNLAK